MKSLVINLILLVMVASLISCVSFKNTNRQKPDLQSKNDVYKILHYASLAGSSHNSQPWKAEVYGQDSILVYPDFSRNLMVVDKTCKELYISIGAFIENLDIAANNYGYKTIIAINEIESDNTKPVASIKLFKTTNTEGLFDLTDIENRTTLRIPFDILPIKKEDSETLVNLSSANIHFISSETTTGKFIAQNEYEAYAQQSRNEQAKEELAKWIRFSNKEVKEKSDGLTPAGMGIKGIGGFFVRNFLKPKDSKKESFVEKGIEKTKTQVNNCGGWVIITQGNNNIPAWVNVGRLYERININCRKLFIGFHPMNQIIEEENFAIKTTDFLKLNGQIMLVARIGYVKEYPKPVSLRRPVESFCIFR